MGKDTPDPEEEGEEDRELPGVPQVPQVETGKGSSPLPATPTLPSEASRQDASGETSKETSSSKLMPERFLTLDSSNDELYTDSLTSHTTATDSTPTNLTSCLDPSLHPKCISKTESQFSSSMPYLEHSTPAAHTKP